MGSMTGGTRNQVVSTSPDIASGQYLGEARNAARSAYNTAINTPYYAGDRVASINPLQQQGADQTQQIAGLFGPATQQMFQQSRSFDPAAAYFNQQMQYGGAGSAQQLAASQAAGGAQNALQYGMDQQYGGLGTVNAANGLFGQGATAQQMQAAQLPGWLAANQSLLSPNVVNALDARTGAGDAAQSRIGQYSMDATRAGYDAATGALTGAPDTAAFMNPFQSQVVDAVRQQFDQTRDLTNRSISDRYQMAGAFGGDREAIARGSALAGIARDETSQLAALTKQGYDDAIARAMQQQQFRSSAGQSLFGQGMNAMGQQAGSGDAALAQRLSLFNTGLGNIGSAAQGGAGALFSGGLGAGQFLANTGQQNANTLYGGGNAAGQFLSQQGSFGANQAANYGADATRSLFGAGVQGTDALGQYGTLFRNYQQQQLEANQAAMQEPITRQQQALGLLFQGVNGGGSSTSTPLYSNPLGSALGYASAGLGLYNQFRNTFGGGSNGGGMTSAPQYPTTNNPFDFNGGTYVPSPSGFRGW